MIEYVKLKEKPREFLAAFFSKDSKLMATGGKAKDPKRDTGVVWTIQ